MKAVNCGIREKSVPRKLQCAASGSLLRHLPPLAVHSTRPS